MALPLVALWGVENEQVVRDIAAACRGDYSYLHRTLNSLDGMDFALLYYGDLFYPTRDEPGRRYLYVEGELGRDTVGLALCGDARMAQWVVRDLRAERPHVKLIVLGRSGSPSTPDAGDCATRPGAPNRPDGARYDAPRTVADARPYPRRTPALTTSEGDVFARRYLVDQKSGNPLTTYSRGVYRGGYGYSPSGIHLHPVEFFGYFEKFSYFRNPFDGNSILRMR